MNVNLISFIGQTLVYSSSFLLSWYGHEKLQQQEVDERQCYLLMAFDSMYCLVWLSDVVRCLITGYMNIKFSRSLQLTNRLFTMTFNAEMPEVRDGFQQEQKKLEDDK